MARLVTPVGSTVDLGSRPIVDFDGTMARLDIDWSGLRDRLGVHSISDLWTLEDAQDGVSGPWSAVLVAEKAAAATALAVEPVVAALTGVEGFAVLSNNSETAIRIFCDRYPALRTRLRLVVGREALRGPKTDPACFQRGFAACRDALHPGGGPADGTQVYAGDQDYELELAARLGARTLAISA